MSNNVASNISIGISMDTKQLQRETRQMLRILNDAKRDLRNYSGEMALLRKEHEAGSIGVDAFTAAMNRMILRREKNREKIAAEAEAVRLLTGEYRIAEASRRDQSEFADETARLKREAQQAAEAQERLAKAVKDSLQAQRQSAYETSRNAELSVNPSARRQSLLAEVAAMQSAGGLSRRGAQQLLGQDAASYMRQFATERQKVNVALREANSLYRSGVLSADQYALATRRIRQESTLLGRSLTQIKSAAGGVLGPVAVGYAGLSFLKDSIRANAELQATMAELRIYTGSQSGAERLLAEQQALTAGASVNLASVQKASRVLLQYGVNVQEVTGIVRTMTEITGGNSERLEQMALAYAQVQAAGRLMGQENIQLINAGFSPLMEISQRTGKTMARLKKEMEAGAVSSEMVAQAFRDAVAEGGRFNGLLDEIAQTSQGKLTRLVSEIDRLKASVGGLLEPLTNNLADDSANTLGILRQISDAKVTKAATSGLSNQFTSGPALSLFGFTGVYRQWQELERKYLSEPKKLKSQLDQAMRDAVQTDRVAEVFDKLLAKQEEAVISAQYEKDVAERVLAIRQQSVGEERTLVDELIRQQASYEEIIYSVNTTAGAEAERLRELQDQTAEIERQSKQSIDLARESAKAMDDLRQQDKEARSNAANEIEALKSQVQYQEELVVLGEELARIEQLKRDRQFTTKEAEALAAEERRMKLLERQSEMAQQAADIAEANNPNADFVKTMAELEALRASGQLGQADYLLARQRALSQSSQGGPSINAAPVAEKGSQEAYQALTGQTVDKMNTQLRVQEEQKLLQKTANEILTRANGLLEEIAKQKIKKVGP